MLLQRGAEREEIGPGLGDLHPDRLQDARPVVQHPDVQLPGDGDIKAVVLERAKGARDEVLGHPVLLEHGHQVVNGLDGPRVGELEGLVAGA